MATCIRGNYNCAVKVVDQDNMIYQDLSDWMGDPPGSYGIRMIRPATSESIDLEVSGTDNTRISTSEIGTITDGIYTFETDSCGTRYTRRKGLFFNIECCIKKAYTEAPPRVFENIREVQEYLQMTKSAIEIGQIELANELFEITQEKMERIKCDCGC